MLSTPFNIKNIKFPNRVFLAPMSGVSDLPFRTLAYEYGAGMVVSEMIASEKLCQKDLKTKKRASHKNGVHTVQLVGHNPYLMSEAARALYDEGAALIDINMGCPAKKITGRLCGASLMTDLNLAENIIDSVLQAVPIPISIKIRLGWDETQMNATEVAKRAEELGVSMITIHGRTRQQFYNGKADWNQIAQVVRQVSIPIVANGDVTNQKEALDILRITKASAVMIGRASYGQPWLCGEISGHGEPPKCLSDYVVSHYQDMLFYYGKDLGLRHARKHLDWYLKKWASNRYTQTTRTLLMRSESVSNVENLLKQILK